MDRLGYYEQKQITAREREAITGQGRPRPVGQSSSLMWWVPYLWLRIQIADQLHIPLVRYPLENALKYTLET